MCGIVGLVNGHAVAADLVTALGRLEYRGYDSAGIAVAGPGFAVQKVAGRAAGLSAGLDDSFAGQAGIAHTRWATHGRAETRNAHPHVHDGIAVVHNGIIENHAELRQHLIAEGHSFASDTDSEVIPHLIAVARAHGAAPVAAVRETCAQLHGAYAIAVLFEDAPDHLVVARQGSPVMVARGEGTSAVASDPTALAGFCHEFAALEDGDIADLTRDGVTIANRAGSLANRDWQVVTEAEEAAALAGFHTYTRAEIAAQPAALVRTDTGLDNRTLTPSVAAAERLVVVACGSSLYAASTARAWIEELSGVPCDLEIASEFRTRNAPLSRNTVAILVSQSGETADTLAVQQMFRAKDIPCVAVVNVAHSQMARDAELVWPTRAGRELGVAATKSFTCQLLALVRFGLALGEARGTVSPEQRAHIEMEIATLPAICTETELLEPQLKAVAQRIAYENEAMFIGRGPAAAIAAEGALKLKELSYIRAEAYAAGELKHGPIALIRENSPVVVCGGEHADKTLSNSEEVRSRGAAIISLIGAADAPRFAAISAETVVLPGHGLSLIFAQAVAVQLISVHAAEALGCDVDRPRNLAKSVTVE